MGEEVILELSLRGQELVCHVWQGLPLSVAEIQPKLAYAKKEI